jgi:hypothetical protein
MRHGDEQTATRPRRGRRLAAATLALGLAGPAAALTGAAPSNPVAQLMLTLARD